MRLGARAHTGINASDKGTVVRPTEQELSRGRKSGPAMTLGNRAPQTPQTPRAGLGFSMGLERPSCLPLRLGEDDLWICKSQEARTFLHCQVPSGP